MPRTPERTDTPRHPRHVRLGLAALLVCGVAAPLATMSGASARPAGDAATTAVPDDVTLKPLGTVSTGLYDEGGSEIVAWDRTRYRAFSVNAKAGTVDVLDLTDPSNPTKISSLTTPGANSVAVRGDLIAVATQAEDKIRAGKVLLFDAATLEQTASYPTTALPDMVTITGDGRYVLTANEGEPSGYCSGDRDPQGSVTIVDLRAKRATNAKFTAFDSQRIRLRQQGVRLFGPGASVSEDLEPEYIAVSGDSTTAWVTLQENNAIATVDITGKRITAVKALSVSDHSRPGYGIDASDKDGGVTIAPRPVKGYYMPDGIARFDADGTSYLVTANEGDARDYDCYSEEERVKKLELDPEYFPDAATLQSDAELGPLTVTTTGPRSADGYTGLRTFGTRSVTVRDAATQRVVWDSGDRLEQLTAQATPELFNADNAENDSMDSRSDNKGPEPEGVDVGTIGWRQYAFVGLERNSGIAVVDVTTPASAKIAGYGVNRDDSGDPEAGTAGDLGPEGVHFVHARFSPTGKPLLLVGNEVSGTTTVWEVTRNR